MNDTDIQTAQDVFNKSRLGLIAKNLVASGMVKTIAKAIRIIAKAEPELHDEYMQELQNAGDAIDTPTEARQEGGNKSNSAIEATTPAQSAVDNSEEARVSRLMKRNPGLTAEAALKIVKRNGLFA